MSDLDVIREARDYLAGFIERSENLDPAPWVVNVYQPEQATVNGSSGYCVAEYDGVFMPDTASLIVALRAAAPQIIRLFDRQVLNTPNGWVDPEVYLLARAILETKGQDDD